MTPMFCEFNSQADGNTVSIILKSAELHSPQVQNYKAISVCTNSRWMVAILSMLCKVLFLRRKMLKASNQSPNYSILSP